MAAANIASRTATTTRIQRLLGPNVTRQMENDGYGTMEKGKRWRVLPKAGACCSVVYSGLELPGCSVPPAVDCEGATSYRVAPLTRIGDGVGNRRTFEKLNWGMGIRDQSQRLSKAGTRDCGPFPLQKVSISPSSNQIEQVISK